MQVRLACEHQPIRVLDPLPDDLVIGQAEGVLQIQQAGNQRAEVAGRPRFDTKLSLIAAASLLAELL